MQFVPHGLGDGFPYLVYGAHAVRQDSEAWPLEFLNGIVQSHQFRSINRIGGALSASIYFVRGFIFRLRGVEDARPYRVYGSVEATAVGIHISAPIVPKWPIGREEVGAQLFERWILRRIVHGGVSPIRSLWGLG